MKTIKGKTVSAFDFIDGIKDVRPDNFSCDGLMALFEYLDGDDFEFDPIGICCEFIEYDKAIEAAKESGFEPDDPEYYDDDELEKKALEWIIDKRSAIIFDGGVIVHI